MPRSLNKTRRGMSTFYFQPDPGRHDRWDRSSAPGPLRHVTPGTETANENRPSAVFREVAGVLLVVAALWLAIKLGLWLFLIPSPA